jgi:predicted amidohydrolase
MRIAGIQFSCLKEKKKNVEKALSLLSVAIEKGAKIVCFQEIFNLFWFPREKNEAFFSLAEEANSTLFNPFFEKAREKGVVILLPFFERAGKRFYNSCMVINEKGEISGVYRKVHLSQIPLWEETYYFSRGEGFPVFSTGYGRIGVQISWDNLFPEGTRILALKGAEIVFAPTSCAFKTQHLWQTAISGNAIFNGLYIMRVNRVGSEDIQDFYGMSFCVNPEGEIISGPAGINDGIVIADVDLEYERDVRKTWPLLKARVPEVYSDLVKKGD